MIKRRSLLAAGGAAMAAGGLARPSLAQGAKVLKYVPQANLANPDPIWTTATVATIHGYMVWDTLYGIDAGLIPRPQMVAGHQISSDGKTWRLTLRDGLFWHDGPPVRSTDCIPSIQRWGKRDPLGQKLMSLVTGMKAVDDKNFEISLSKPFSLLPYVLGAAGCFIMPERIAKTDAFTQINEFVGSGPFKFLRNEWVSGSSAAYAKFDKYTPRSEPPSYWSGGKVANFDRVEWKIIPDPATAAAALQTGEVDWVEQPLIDLLPTLRKSPDVVVEVLDPLGALGIIAFNHTLPPFNSPKMLQAVLHAVDQKEYVQAVVGAQPQLGREPVGFFTAGSPYANDVGIAALTSPRDLTLAKKLVAESGYKGEKVVLMSPSDQPQLQIMAQVTADLYKKLGLNVDYVSMDWGTLVSRRASKKPIDQGGWNSFCTTWGGLQVSNPGSSFPLRGNGGAGWFGWPNDPKMEALREQWFDAPDLKAQQVITGEMQALAFKDVPFIPVGQWFTPTAHRKNLVDFVKSGTISFWSVKRV
ncbi:MAG: ABC transporter substrate-binding protein [Rhodospirillales bacterium]|nr:ABC transporter substrate-binding protein [Rhodospirillales bacterium]MDE2200738.1 ABC transporter substrate-binding protein [Rhodospirillales bacterium]MDE2573931.1 ABC transporter substrate-binding protein [Rhodospirillales bacterium]